MATLGQAIVEIVGDASGFQDTMRQVERTMGETSREISRQTREINRQFNEQWDNPEYVAKMEQVKQKMIASNEKFMAKATQSAKMINDFSSRNTRVLDRQFLRLGDSLERMANQGRVVNVVLNDMNHNGSMKQILERIQYINQGLGRMQALQMGMLFAVAGYTYGMVKLSNAVDGRLIPASKEFIDQWKKALTPIAKAWTSWVVKIIEFGTYLGKVVETFTKANPVISGMIGNIMYLATVFTLLLSPLAIGIARGQAFRVAFMALFTMIKPFVLGFLAVIGTALALATAIVGIVLSINLMLKHSKKFRDTIANVWASFKRVVLRAFEPVLKQFEEFKKAWSRFTNAIFGGASTFEERWKKIGDTIATVIQVVAPLLLKWLGGAFRVLASIIFPILRGLTLAFGWLAKYFEENGGKINGVVAKIGAVIKLIFTEVGAFLDVLVPKIVSVIKNGWSLIATIIQFLMPFIAGLVKLYFGYIQGVVAIAMAYLVPLVKTAWNIIKTTILAVLDHLSLMLQFWKQVFTGDWKGAWETVKKALANALQLIFDLVKIWFNDYIMGEIESFSNLLGIPLDKVKTAIENTFKWAFEGAKYWMDKITSALSNIFNTNIKTPSFSISGDLANPKSWLKNPPKLKVNWNATGNIFDGASILGGGQGVGEAGAEVVMPIERKRYMKPYASMVAELLKDLEAEENQGGNILNTFNIASLVVREEADIKRIAEELERQQRKQNRAKGTMAF